MDDAAKSLTRDDRIHSEAEKRALEMRLRESVVDSLNSLIRAWEVRPANLPSDTANRLQEAIAQAERLKETLDELIRLPLHHVKNPSE